MIYPLLICSVKSGSGKDYVADKLVQVLAQHQVAGSKFKIADPLKKLCYKYFETRPPNEYEDNRELRQEKLVHSTAENVVDLWIKVGEFFRSLDNTFLIRQCADDIFMKYDRWRSLSSTTTRMEQPNVPYVAIMPDFRFDSEHDYLQKLSYTVPNLIVPPQVVQVNVPPGRGTTHASDALISPHISRMYIYNDFSEYIIPQIEGITKTLMQEWIKSC